MNFHHLLKILVKMQVKLLKAWAISIVKNSAKESTTDAIKPASKRAIQKPAEVTSDLIGNKTADKITSISKSPNELHLVESRSKTDEMK